MTAKSITRLVSLSSMTRFPSWLKYARFTTLPFLLSVDMTLTSLDVLWLRNAPSVRGRIHLAGQR